MSFIKETHYLLSISKDFESKFWDMDTFENIFVFDQALSPLTSICVSSIGDRFYVSDMGGPIHTYVQTKE